MPRTPSSRTLRMKQAQRLFERALKDIVAHAESTKPQAGVSNNLGIYLNAIRDELRLPGRVRYHQHRTHGAPRRLKSSSATGRSTQPKHSSGSSQRVALSDRELDKFYERFVRRRSTLTFDDIDKIDSVFSSINDRRCRKGALLPFTMSSAEFVEKMNDKDFALAFAHVALAADDYVKRLKMLTELIETGSGIIRVGMVNRPDMDELFRIAASSEGDDGGNVDDPSRRTSKHAAG